MEQQQAGPRPQQSPDQAQRALGHPQPKALSTPAFLAWVLGLTLLVFGLSFLAGSETRLVGLLIFLPAIAASVGTVRQTQAASVWATAGGAISVARNPGYHLDDAITLVLTLLFAVLAVFGARWRIARDTELLRLRSTAAVIQQHILHPLPEFTSQVRVDGIFEPLQEDKLFGGDIYDVADTPYGTRVLIGDVQGKGLSAVGAAFAVLGGFREAAHREPALTGLVGALETSVVRHNAYARHSGEAERFVTALVVSIDPLDRGTAQVVNCGHLAPFLVRDALPPDAVRLGATGVPLGLASLVREERSAAGVCFPPDSTMLLYTDGLSEARDGHGAFYPLAERLAALVGPAGAAADTTGGELARALRDDVRAFSHPYQQDDLAVLTLRRISPADRARAVRPGVAAARPNPREDRPEE
ncbi:PP2C family protein-serine/threonine phosphatase [Streptomyces qinglanensis]|uniref:PP2C family protein-serine/threonine phosphatase n=1 Tax=Streptomyces qinglanensis TaxID=943816 RepID=UPI00085CAF7F|nr:PP2C family protein-serine/threonine phosphatase [Streptomyces qinglanensis]